MSIVILTTQSAHHTFFINRIAEIFDVSVIFYETKHIKPKFSIGPLFEEEESAFENKYFFQNLTSVVSSDIPTHEVETVNDDGVSDLIASYDADIGLVFGCRKIKPHVFESTKKGLINVHRGISEKYRGLDSDLWAIARDDAKNIGVTLHEVAEQLDTGQIYRCCQLPIVDRVKTHQIRYYTTVMATEMMMDLLVEYTQSGKLKGRTQKEGEYFSFMPLETKQIVRDNFDKQASTLNEDYNANLFYFNRRIQDQLCILLYHGVTDHNSLGIENYSQKHITVEEFHAQMKYVAKNCNLMSMPDVSRHCSSGKPFPERAVAVSFDDAFENVHTFAEPILSEYNIPFTFYVSTSFIDSERMFWVDIIEDCLNRTTKDNIAIRQMNTSFDLKSEKSKIEACSIIKDNCKKIPIIEVEEIISALVDTTEVTPNVEASPNYRKISWKQLRRMSKNPLVTIGGHTHTHNIMSQMTPQTLEYEVSTSLQLLRSNLNQDISHYSYPEGQAHHYNDRVIDILKKQGIVCSPSAIAGLNHAGDDPFHLRRVMVGFTKMPFPYFDEQLTPQYSA